MSAFGVAGPGVSAPLRVVVVDDEAMSRARLRRLLGQQRDVEVVAECGDGDSALAALRRLRPAVVFLDIRLPDLNGFGVIEALPLEQRPQVVFVTAHAEHALRAFDARAVDYLLKPYSAERLQAALERIRRLRAPALPFSASAEGFAQRLAVPVGARLRLLPVEAIECVIAQSNYVELRADDQTYVLRETLSGLQARLDPRRFVRIHRSRIVRVDAVRDIEHLDGGRYVLRLTNGLRLASGASYRERVREAMGLG